MRYSTVGVSNRMYDLLNLRPGEGRIVTFLLIFSFFQYFAVALFFITASAIFLSGHNNMATSLPYVYIGSGLLLLLNGCSKERKVVLYTEDFSISLISISPTQVNTSTFESVRIPSNEEAAAIAAIANGSTNSDTFTPYRR